MKAKFIFTCIALFLLMFHQISSQKSSSDKSWSQLYNKAEALFSGSSTDSTDSLALTLYSKVISAINPDAVNATTLYNCYERSGILKQGLSYSSEETLHDYYAALLIHKTFHLSDSMLFRLLLSVGNVHYNDALFDSAVFYFSRAEKIINQYPKAGLAGDLYNSLGALYSEAGNYMQSGIYFNKALELTRQNHPELGEAIFAMSANVASAVKLSGYPDSALMLYKKLLDVKQPSLAIINNIGSIYLTKKLPDSALHYLHMAVNLKGNYAIAVYNAMAQACILKHDAMNAEKNLQAAENLYKQNIQHNKSNSFAATEKYLGDLMMMQNKPQQALQFYQQSLIQYDFKFNNKNPFVNPGNFIGDFASYNLFDALIAKANCLGKIYTVSTDEKYFTSTITTYDSAFALADYIKKSIDNDESRLFIADKVFNAYATAVDFLSASNKSNTEALKIHALQWVSQSRATSLIINLKENTIKQYAGLPDSLLQEEKNTKINISRLKLQLQQSPDSAQQIQLLSAINTASLKLQNIDNTFENYPAYYKEKFAVNKIDIRSIQKNILNKETAALCYFKGKNNLYAFVVQKNNITEHTITFDTTLIANISNYLQALTHNNPGEAYDNTPAKYLYTKLVSPLANFINNNTSLIIIPDESLINIPFEAFETDDNNYLIQQFAISYQYTLPLLQEDVQGFNQQNAIAFAPFANSNSNTSFSVLSASIKEISFFKKGERIIDAQATKNKFMNMAGNASLIHLATHAAVNFNEPENSYITFYAQSKIDSSYKIYAHELYNLQLQKTKLVFLSACETGSGKISQSEGALSLSRAFAFAGCPNIITSLWKAEDESTAYISQKFYKYVDKDYSYAHALQKAKTDLLNDETMSQFHSPVYWSHLIFIGDVQEEKSFAWLWIIVLAIAVIIILFVFRRKLFKRNVAA